MSEDGRFLDAIFEGTDWIITSRVLTVMVEHGMVMVTDGSRTALLVYDYDNDDLRISGNSYRGQYLYEYLGLMEYAERFEGRPVWQDPSPTGIGPVERSSGQVRPSPADHRPSPPGEDQQ